jgi:hypothetical protein
MGIKYEQLGNPAILARTRTEPVRRAMALTEPCGVRTLDCTRAVFADEHQHLSHF